MSTLSPSSETFNFSIKKGEDFSMEVLIRDKGTHEPIDTAGMTFEGICRDHVKGAELFRFQFTKHANPLSGIVTVTIARRITSAIAPDAGVYDMFLLENNLREPFLEGKIVFQPFITG